LLPYTKNTTLWVCPDDWGAFDRLHRERATFRADYGVSYRWDVRLAGRSSEEIAEAAATPVMFDREPFHGDGRNVGFADGHVKWISEDRFGDYEVDAK